MQLAVVAAVGNLFRVSSAITAARQVGLADKNSVAFSPQANYTDRATAACRRS
jgi:hypothetical protein